MVFDCPECGTRQRGGTPGAVVACSSCRNPVVVPEPPPRRLDAPTEVPHATDPNTGGPGRLWGTAALVLVIVAAAHAGLFLLLTADARNGLRRIESVHSCEELSGATRPDQQAPQPGTPDYAPWRRQVELYDDAQAWGNHRRHVALLRSGFLASFLVQVGITLWILLKVLAKQKKHDSLRQRHAASSSS